VKVIDLIAGDPLVDRLVEAVGAEKTPVAVSGLWGSSAPILARILAARSKRPLLFITAHLDDADAARDDLESLFDDPVDLLPAWEGLPGEGAANAEIVAERAALCSRLVVGLPPATIVPAIVPTIVAPIQALLAAVPKREALNANALEVAVRQRIDPQKIVEWLVSRGFTRLDQVEQGGDFALRGGILDVLVSGTTDALRIEFFDDQIESIREFEVGSQRSTRQLERTRIALPPDPTKTPIDQTTHFLDFLPPNALVAIAEPAEVQELARTVMNRLGTPAGMYPVEAIFRNAVPFNQLHLSRFGTATAAESRSFTANAAAPPAFDAKPADAVQQLIALSRESQTVVFCDNQGEIDRLRELFTAAAATPHIETTIGYLNHGFIWRPTARSLSPSKGQAPDSSSLALVANREVFHRYTQRHRIRRVASGRPLDSFLDLQPGDYVVHVIHGIAQFIGMKTMQKGTSKKFEEYLTLRFAESATIHVPVSQIDLVQKYIGAGGARPQLSKLGTARWKATKARVEEAVGDLASELLRVQAERDTESGTAYPADTTWQAEFENSFIYTETPDQLTALGDIKRDMARPRPMDRLLCGDVGYGKTELAIRAAFKVVEFGKQVALLVPTTVLAEQHWQTFRERLADYPFRVECLSRFRSKKEQTDIINRARKGQVDVLIGTHRLLSKDVRFADLGLVVIDEEQRFGVEHKERLKMLRSTVDVLTMTATPIPRTLHMSMIGLRDISALATPPMDRRSITTSITHWSDDQVRAAVLRELNRDGQIYFVHNRVKSIRLVADRLKRIVPEAKFLVGHGQMPPEELEDVMLRFIRHEADVLVCTTIIESGLDIATCNTIFIDRADTFGLADLHQLRGRVGRDKHRAYCYLLLSPDRPITDSAAKRLKAIEEFSELGAGFHLAMRDLEIRGAGNLLGAEQSGNIAAVGYEMYCQLLEAAVRRMKGEAPQQQIDVHLELNVEAYVPRHYIQSDRQRMEVYRRITSCRTPAEVERLEADLVDAFGKPPTEVETLLTLADIRVRAAALRIRSIIRREPDLIFTTDDIKKTEPAFIGATGSVRLVDAQTIHWRLPDNYFHGQTLLRILRSRLTPTDVKPKKLAPA